MATIAFVGLGIMGGPMVADLVDAGHDVTGYNHSSDAVDRLVVAGDAGRQRRSGGVERRRRHHHAAGLAGRGWDVVPRTRAQPDTRHRFLVDDRRPAIHVRLALYPDGGLTRLRCNGEVDADALADLRRRFEGALAQTS